MHDDLIRWHITRVAHGDARADLRLSAATRQCWPGGPEDRTEPPALDWLRQWRPAQALGVLPACSCRAGRCTICN